jgi:ERCC4-type nuclease
MIQLDTREAELIKIFEFLKHPVDIVPLHLGDALIHNIIIERKTLNDLAASIKDGRYKEQSFRLQKALEEDFKVFYMIEGNLDLYTGSIPKETLMSAIYSLMMKGFQVLLTKNTKETAYFMIQFYEKHKKEKEREKVKEKEGSVKENIYEDTIVVKQKNTNITRDNVSIFMLCQIPSVSHVTATILMDNYKHISTLLEEMKQTPTLLEEFEYIHPKTNKPKKLNKNIVQKLNEYLNYR